MVRLKFSLLRAPTLAGGIFIVASAGFAATSLLFAQTKASTGPHTEGASVAQSFDTRLLRLSEILGAVHHLREICGANEGQLWRDQMTKLMKAEQPPAQLRARMIAAFNSSYRGFQRTYSTCTPSAKTATTRFFSEGMTITRGLAAEFKDETEQNTAESPPSPQVQSAR